MPFRIRCQCGRRLTAPDSAAGKTVRCPGCQRTFTLPEPPPPTPTPPPPPGGLGEEIPGIKPRPPGSSTFGVKVADSRARVYKERGPAPAKAGADNVCPFCQAPREPDAVICLNCGLNFQTGQRITTAQEGPRGERREAGGAGILARLRRLLGR